MHLAQIVVFPSLQEIGFVKFFLNCCVFPFSGAKSYGLIKKWGHRVNFLVISDISEKSGLENLKRDATGNLLLSGTVYKVDGQFLCHNVCACFFSRIRKSAVFLRLTSQRVYYYAPFG